MDTVHAKDRFDEHERAGPVHQGDSALGKSGPRRPKPSPSRCHGATTPGDPTINSVADYVCGGPGGHHDHHTIHRVGHVRQPRVRDVTFQGLPFGRGIDRVERSAAVAQASIDGVGELFAVSRHPDERQMPLGEELVDSLLIGMAYSVRAAFFCCSIVGGLLRSGPGSNGLISRHDKTGRSMDATM